MLCEKGWDRIYSLTTSILLSKRMGKIARTFFSVTIKATELVLIKQDTWSRWEQHVNVPARLQTHLLYSHALFCSQYCSTVADLSLDMYTSWKKACNKEIRQNKSWLLLWRNVPGWWRCFPASNNASVSICWPGPWKAWVNSSRGAYDAWICIVVFKPEGPLKWPHITWLLYGH